MPFRRGPTVAAALLGVTGGCAPAWYLSQSTRSPVIAFDLVSTDITMRVTVQVIPPVDATRRLAADVGRCQVLEDDNGLSGLAYPLDPADPLPTRTAAVITLASAGGPGGAIDLIRSGDKHVRLPEPDGQFSYALMLPLFIVQPFDVLPDRLAAAVADPKAAPALVELARDLVDCPAVGVAGSLRGAGLFTARLSLTEAGRIKLRAALARRAHASSQPSAAAARPRGPRLTSATPTPRAEPAAEPLGSDGRARATVRVGSNIGLDCP